MLLCATGQKLAIWSYILIYMYREREREGVRARERERIVANIYLI